MTDDCPILIVEDEPKLAALLQNYLIAAGYPTRCLDNGLQVVPTVRAQTPRLILLDLMLPGRDGMQVCQDLRGFSAVPIIMITARVEEVDRLRGLDLGADDYICKPFSPREVVARVKAILRRGPQLLTGAAPRLIIDDAQHRVVTDHTVDSHIRNLRRKLEQACPGETPIESLYGVGYRFQLTDA